MLPKGEATKVKCQVPFGPVPEGMPMIFELPEGLELGEEITKTTLETSSHLSSRSATIHKQKHLAKAQDGTGPSTHG